MSEYRLAKGITDASPREWTTHEKYQLYLRGFGDGAGRMSIRRDHHDVESYVRGYNAGAAARIAACNAYCEEIGHVPSVLRAADV